MSDIAEALLCHIPDSFQVWSLDDGLPPDAFWRLALWVNAEGARPLESIPVTRDTILINNRAQYYGRVWVLAVPKELPKSQYVAPPKTSTETADEVFCARIKEVVADLYGVDSVEVSELYGAPYSVIVRRKLTPEEERFEEANRKKQREHWSGS